MSGEGVKSMVDAQGFFLTAPRTVEWRRFSLPEPGPGEARVRVAGCGLCHTDETFYSGLVRTRHAPPLVLGHEIAGRVEAAAGEYAWLAGQDVIVPAVMPCERCDLCRLGHDTACAAQIMPGNDVNGGFATHVVVPARHLVPIGPDIGGLQPAELAVVADAVTTPFAALHRVGATAGDLVAIVGVGGIGSYGVQLASALGAQVAAIDVSPDRLARAARLGARWTFDAVAGPAKAIRRQLLEESGVSTCRWKILEMSGTAAGQETAWALLGPGATLGVVGYTTDRPAIRLSNLMALDATAVGCWGCSPHLYPAAVDLVRAGRVDVRSLVDLRPLEDLPALLEGRATTAHGRRAVLVPS